MTVRVEPVSRPQRLEAIQFSPVSSVCPLAPNDNTTDIPIPAGERLTLP